MGRDGLHAEDPSHRPPEPTDVPSGYVIVTADCRELGLHSSFCPRDQVQARFASCFRVARRRVRVVKDIYNKKKG
jgi:hypothetical protein